MIRLARGMVHFYVFIAPEVITESWREIRGAMRSQVMARSRR